MKIGSEARRQEIKIKQRVGAVDYRMRQIHWTPVWILAVVVGAVSASAQQYAPAATIFNGHKGNSGGVAFSRDGKTLAVSSDYNNKIELWNPLTGQLKKTIDAKISGDKSLAYSPDGTRLAGGSADGSAIIWKMPNP